MALTGRQRHQHPTHVHSLGSEHIGSLTLGFSATFKQSGDHTLSTVSHRWKTHSSFASTPMARPQVRGHRRSTPTIRRMATQSKLLQPPWDLLPSFSTKLHQSGASSTVIASYWPHKPWFQQLHNMATETIHYPAKHDNFFSGWQGSLEGVGRHHFRAGSSRVSVFTFYVIHVLLIWSSIYHGRETKKPLYNPARRVLLP
jgi:hypothetical protein